jgi:hypothetical protein
MLRHRAQFDGRRQRLADHHPFLDHDRVVPREPGNNGVRNFHGCADRGTHGAADDGTDWACSIATPRRTFRRALGGRRLSKSRARDQQRGGNQ